MKTKEFIRRVEALNSDSVDVKAVKRDNTTVVTSNGAPVALISHEQIFDVATAGRHFWDSSHSPQAELFKLLTEYASTPVEEREEEKKYYLRVVGIVEVTSYINYHTQHGYCLDTKDQSSAHQTIFTQPEINNFPDDVKKLVSLAEWIPVEEGDS